jgi:hypothetical protein
MCGLLELRAYSGIQVPKYQICHPAIVEFLHIHLCDLRPNILGEEVEFVKILHISIYWGEKLWRSFKPSM